MAVVFYKGIDVIADDHAVRLLKNGNIVFEQGFLSHVRGMSAQDEETYLIRAGIVLADEYIDGSLSGMQDLEPWE